MTLDEAIIHAEEVMMENLEKTKDRNASDPVAIECMECADEHRQLAEWLKDYKEQRTKHIYDLERIRYAIWEVDIPSPTVPEYIEHHQQMQELMALVDKILDEWR